MNLTTGFTLFFFLIITSISISSCDGDCKNEEFEKNEWITKYVDVSKDTLVKYSVIANKSEYLSFDKEILHSFTIKNEDDRFSNLFAVVITYGHFDIDNEISETKTDTTEFSEIQPNSTYTFSFKTQGGFDENYNSSIEILQLPKHISVIKRIDSLKTELITVNSCEQSIETLKEKYQTIKKLFESRNPSVTGNNKDSVVSK